MKSAKTDIENESLNKLEDSVADRLIEAIKNKIH